MERPKKTVTDIAASLFCLFAALFAGWLALRYLMPILLPFLIAWGVALLVRAPAEHLCRHTRIPARVMRLVFALLLIGALAGGLWLVGVRLARELTDLLSTLTSAGAGDPLEGIFAAFPKLASSDVGAWLVGTLRSAVGNLASHLPTLLSRLVSAAPRMLVALAVTLCACAYFCLDLERIHAACFSLFPPRAREWLTDAKSRISRVGGMYFRSYLTLMGVTFAEMLLGLSLLRIGYALLLALLIALVDFLPVLGVGTVLVPWSLVSFVTGNPARGIGLLVLWGVSLAVRQFLEPHLIGRGLGIHPCLTLISMYAGLRLFGIVGMLLCPPAAALLFAWLPRRGGDECARVPPTDTGTATDTATETETTTKTETATKTSTAAKTDTTDAPGKKAPVPAAPPQSKRRSSVPHPPRGERP